MANLFSEGLVVKSTGKWVILRTSAGKLMDARLRGKLKLLNSQHTSPIAVGDKVLYSFSEQDQEANIESILDRKNHLIRKATKQSKQTHIIASNIDLACLIVSISNPQTPLGFIDRFLTMTAAYQIPTLIVINKMDLLAAKSFHGFSFTIHQQIFGGFLGELPSNFTDY